MTVTGCESIAVVPIQAMSLPGSAGVACLGGGLQSLPSFPRKRESILILPAAQKAKWIRACAGMTTLRGLALLSVIAAGFLLAACSPPPVPDVTYFRMPPPAALPHVNKPLTVLPIEVDTFNAEGVY